MEWRLGTWKSKKGTSVALGAVAETDKGSEPAAGPAKAHREIRRCWFLKTGYPILYRIIISFPTNRMAIHGYPVFLYMFIYTFIIIYPIQSSCVYSWDEWRWMKRWDINVAMDQYLYIPFLGGWTSIYQLFWCSPGVKGFDTLPYGFRAHSNLFQGSQRVCPCRRGLASASWQTSQLEQRHESPTPCGLSPYDPMMTWPKHQNSGLVTSCYITEVAMCCP